MPLGYYNSNWEIDLNIIEAQRQQELSQARHYENAFVKRRKDGTGKGRERIKEMGGKTDEDSRHEVCN